MRKRAKIIKCFSISLYNFVFKPYNIKAFCVNNYTYPCSYGSHKSKRRYNMNKYQLLFIIENGIGDEAKQAVVDKFSELIVTLGGTVSSVDKWGTKAYAYPIDYKTEGYYVLVTFEAAPEVPAEVDRQMRNNENIVRQMITRG